MNMKCNSILMLGFAVLAGTPDHGLAATPDSAGTVVTLPAEIAAPNTPVIAVYKVNSFCEGPAWNGQGRLTFSSTNSGLIYSYEPATKTQGNFLSLAGANGQEYANDGRLYVCARGGIYSFNAQGGDKQTFLTASPDPNDLSFDSKGNLFFSTYNPNFSYKAANGTAKTVNPKAYKSSNGIEYLEEAGILYVNDYAGSMTYKYTVGPDGNLSNETTFTPVSSPDGITIDEMGNVYVSSGLAGTIVVFNSAGLKLGEIIVSNALGGDTRPGLGYNTSNCAFGGPDRKTLFITGDGGLYAVQLKVAGRQRPSSSSILRSSFRLGQGRVGSRVTRKSQTPPRGNIAAGMTLGFFDTQAQPRSLLLTGRLLPGK